MNDAETKRRAQQAENLLRDDVLIGAFDALESEYTRAMTNTRPSDAQGREEAYRYLHTVKRLRGHLETMVASQRLTDRQRREAIGKKSYNPLRG